MSSAHLAACAVNLGLEDKRMTKTVFRTALPLLCFLGSGLALAQEAESEVEAPVSDPNDVAPAPGEPDAPPSEPEVAPAEPAPAPLAEVPVEEAPAAVEPVPEPGYIDPKLNIGTGLRVEYTLDPDVPGQNFGQGIGTNIRPYINGQLSRDIKFEANLDSTVTVVAGEALATFRVLDAVIKLEFHDLFNVWVGRFLPPSDRANLSGPYFQNSWHYPVNANLFPAIFAGRHDGAAYWGQVGGGRFKWQLGMFDMTGGDTPLLAGRVVLNLLDPEPGYYNSSTYYGTKDVLALAGTIHYQDGGDVTVGSQIDGAAAEADVLFEKRLGGAGTLTLEGAYYNFSDTGFGQSVKTLASYLLPGKQGIGTLQPGVRLQVMMPDVGDDYATVNASVAYIIDGHNLRFALDYQHTGEHDMIAANDTLTLGGQIQIF